MKINWLIIFSASLSWAILVTQATAVAVAATGGPLGSPVGNSPGTIPASGDGSPNNSSTNTSATLEDFQTGVRALDTILAVACVLLTTTTYAVLIGPGTRLLSTYKLLSSYSDFFAGPLRSIAPGHVD